MRRGFSIRIATLVFVIFTMTAPAFAAPSRNDSPAGVFERVIERMVKQIRKIFEPVAQGDVLVIPKG
jgi:hypothetical protein